jgi:hypothetical protein
MVNKIVALLALTTPAFAGVAHWKEPHWKEPHDKEPHPVSPGGQLRPA